MCSSDRPVKVALRLDNGDTIRGSVGSSDGCSAQLVRIRQQIDAGELTPEAQKERLDGIARIYQRLNGGQEAQRPHRTEAAQVCRVYAAGSPGAGHRMSQLSWFLAHTCLVI